MRTSEPRGLRTLQELLKPKPPTVPGERCEYCAEPLAVEHSHLVDVKARRILCACRPCYLVFEPKGAALGRYKPVPSRYADLGEFALDDALWEQLQIPIGLAFFFYSSADARMAAFYPGPAGATESQLPLETWDAIASREPLLTTLEPDTEAVLIARTKDLRQAFIVPIDAAYELVGAIRTSWRGFDGGTEAWERIEAFFARVADRSRGLVTAPRR